MGYFVLSAHYHLSTMIFRVEIIQYIFHSVFCVELATWLVLAIWKKYFEGGKKTSDLSSLFSVQHGH